MRPQYYGVLFVVSFLWLSSSVSAETSSWLKTEVPVFKTLNSNVTPPPFSYTDCTSDMIFTTILPNPILLRSAATHTSCAVQTGYGQHDTSLGTIQLNDHSLAGPLKQANGLARSTIPIANSNHIAYPDSSGVSYGSYRYIIKNFADSITTVPQPNGSIYHQLKPNTPASGIKTADGTLIAFQETRFSSNGKWMVGDSHQRGMTRANIETGETLTFSPGYNHANGARPFFVSAISNDGRFVFATARDYDTAKIYDLSTCILNPDPNKAATCQSKELFSFFKQSVPNFFEVKHAQFSGNHTLKLYVTTKLGVTSYVSLTAAGETESLLGYLATGDSFASGEGAYKYIAGTDVRNPFNSCHLSKVSYPFLLAQADFANETQSVSCSGAKMRDIVSFGYSEEVAQSKGKNNISFDNEILAKYLPGYRPQVSFAEKYKPAIITTSIGGNDIGFGKIVLACLAPGTCYNSPQAKLNFFYTIQSKLSQLVKTYESLKQSAATNAQIYTLGYPTLVAPHGNCAVNVRLNAQELLFANQIVSELNKTIALAALKAGVTYIDVENALNSYRLCERKSSELAVNGITAGNDKTFSLPLGSYTLDGYFIGKESYHPNERGHELYAQAIKKAITNKSLTPSTLLAATQSDLTPRRIIEADKLIHDVAVKGKSTPLSAEGLAANSDTKLILRSETDNNLQTIRVSNTGTIHTTITLASNTTPGIYTLALEANNTAGEPIELQKVIYVAQSETDFDGDSILNQDEQCLLVDPANVDLDADGTDDACDNFIDEPPPANTVSASSTVGRGATESVGSSAGTNPSLPDRQITPTTLSPVSSQIGQTLEATAETLGASTSTQKQPLLPENTKQSLAVLLALSIVLSLILFKSWRKRS